MCAPIPDPPPGAQQKTKAMDGESSVDFMKRHMSDPACSGCHTRIDPIGKGFEGYDAIGRLRSTYPSGKAIDNQGRVEGFSNPNFSGGVAFGQLMASTESVQDCVVSHAARWATGRSELESSASESCEVARIARVFRDSSFDLKRTMVELVASDTFRFRAKSTP